MVSLSEHIYVQCVPCTVSPSPPPPCSHLILCSALYEGLLVALDGPSAPVGRGRGEGFSVLGEKGEWRVKQTAEGTILTAVFQTSLAGDWPEGEVYKDSLSVVSVCS